jgi:hypothetical protein
VNFSLFVILLSLTSFVRTQIDPNEYIEVQKLGSSDRLQDYGHTVAANDYLMAIAYINTNQTIPEKGWVNIFLRNESTGKWYFHQKIEDDDENETYTLFGYSLSLYRDKIAIGKPYDTVGQTSQRGTVSMYMKETKEQDTGI